MVNSPKDHPKKKASRASGEVQELQSNSTTAIQEILDGISGTEQFIGNKFVGIIQGLEGDKRNVYITSVTNHKTMEPLIGKLLKALGVVDEVNTSRVIAYIQAHLS